MSVDNETGSDEPILTLEIGNDPEPAPQPAAEAPAEAAEATHEAAPAEETGHEETPPQAAEKPRKGSQAIQQRFSELTARAKAAEKEAADLKRLLSAGGTPPAAEPAAGGRESLTEDQIEERAQRIASAREFNARANAVHAAGVAAFPDFRDSIESLQMVGALDPQSPAFLEAVMEADAPEKVLHHLGGDPDEALRLAKLPPMKLAAEIVKLDAKLNAPKPPPPARKVSAAPPPIAPIAGATEKGFDPNDETTDIDTWIREMDKRDAAKAEQDRKALQRQRRW